MLLVQMSLSDPAFAVVPTLEQLAPSLIVDDAAFDGRVRAEKTNRTEIATEGKRRIYETYCVGEVLRTFPPLIPRNKRILNLTI